MIVRGLGASQQGAGAVNPTQAEALTMIAVQVMADDVATGFGGAGGLIERNLTHR